MSAVSGIGLTQIAKDSLLRSRRDFYFAPQIGDVDKIVTTVDPSTLTVGTALTLAAAVDGLMLRRARRPTLTVTDAAVVAGSELSVRILIVGQRWGAFVSELITATAVASGTPVTATGANVYDEITSVTPQIISNSAAGDDLTVGIDDTSFGHDFPIDNVADVQSIIEIQSDTEQTPTAVSSTTVDASGGPGSSFIKGIDFAVTDRWEVRYLQSVKQDFSGPQGDWR